MLMEILYHITMALIACWKGITWVVLYVIDRPMRRYIIRCYKDSDVTIGGTKPTDIQVHRPDWFYHRIAQNATLALGESYMDGWWDCDRLDEFFCRTIGDGQFKKWDYPWNRLIQFLQFHVFNLQTSKRAWEVAEKHYDLSNELFSSFLDPTMNYSCGFWRDAKDLTEAQQHKMELIGRKLKLEPGMRVLDIGCGWGGLCKFLAETYKVTVVGITVSKEGAALAKERCQGLSVDIRVQDYRDLKEKFDRIVSVGMFEHVGRKNYRTFFKITNRCLTDTGLFLLHTIGIDNNDVPPIEPWVNKYIFPNGILPDHKNIPQSIDNLFCIEDWHNFGQDYDKTLMAWYHNFVQNWPTISHLYEEPKRFFRMWSYYLLLGAGLFRCRRFHCWQIMLTKKGTQGGYTSVR